MISDSLGNAVAEFQLELKNKVKPEFEIKESEESDDDFGVILKSSFSTIALPVVIIAMVSMLIFKRRKQN
jgi:hypothetical protein